MTAFRLNLNRVHDPVRAEQQSIGLQADSEAALSQLRRADVAQSATVLWVVDVAWSRDVGIGQRSIVIVDAPRGTIPHGEDHIPHGTVLLRAEVFPASRFDGMSQRMREVHRQHYMALMRHRRAAAIGKTVGELTPWVDFDPVQIDEDARRWAAGGVRFAGD